MKWIEARKRLLASVGAVLVVGVGLAVLPLGAQTVISADGGIESTSVGFIFPDGTVQATAAVAGSAPVEDTGQQTCYDPTGSTGDTSTCSGTGQDGELQRGVDWPAPRFTDNGNGTVTDNLTGLIWLKLAESWRGFLDGSLRALADLPGGLRSGGAPREDRPWLLPLSQVRKYGDTIPISRAAATGDVEHSARNEYRVPVFP